MDGIRSVEPKQYVLIILGGYERARTLTNAITHHLRGVYSEQHAATYFHRSRVVLSKDITFFQISLFRYSLRCVATMTMMMVVLLLRYNIIMLATIMVLKNSLL